MASPSSRTLLSLTLALATTVASHAAFAQVEARCPAGWEPLPVPPGTPREHVVVACVQDPVQIVLTEIAATVAPGGPEESAGVQQLVEQLGRAGATLTPSAFHNETVTGVAMRVADFAAAPSTPPQALLAFIPHGASTDILMVASPRAGRFDVHAAMRAFLPSVIGLSGTLPPWMASATCPSGMSPAPTHGTPANGMRQVTRCTAEGGTQLDVIESHLPLRTADDARAPAAALHTAINRQLRAAGGSASIDATLPFTAGSAHGFATAVHASASDPNAAPGAPPSALRVEALVVAVPTPSGHVQIVAVSQGGDPAAMRAQVEGFVSTQLRLDGTGVTATPPPSADNGETSSTAGPPSDEPGRHRQPNLDPNAPPWEPPPADRPHASEPPPHKSCGCSTPGAVPSRAWTLAPLAAVACIARRRRRSRA